jgi:NADH-quinone oxidoreductase subunit F
MEETRVLSARFGTDNSQRLSTYVADGGYVAAKTVLTTLKPAQVIDVVGASQLRGLGGAGFPTGKKWSFVPKETTKPKFLVVNADEGEPGTIKDRYIIEQDPHRLIEGIIIAAYAVGAHKSYIYIRGEYRKPAECLRVAIEEAQAAGLLGAHVCGQDFALDIVVHLGAGAYICGEETALLSSLEGYKGFPKLKPPFPAIEGLFRCPTVVNNVETLACLPTIINDGAEAFAALSGVEGCGGTRLFSISGHVSRPGLYEASHRVTLRELIDEYAGGVPNGRTIKAVIPGGISSKILTGDEIDVQMSFEALAAAGTMVGSAAVIVMDDTTCIVQALWRATHFFAHESCGQCSPCREGTGWMHKIVTRIVAGHGRPEDLETLLTMSAAMEGKTICVFADAAAWPVQSYIKKFRDEFEYYIRTGCSRMADPTAKVVAT